MRKVTMLTIAAFMNRWTITVGNTHSDGTALYLHGNKIAEHRADGLYITDAGWSSKTTKERLNGLPGVSISQKNWQWFLNGVQWNGEWIKIN